MREKEHECALTVGFSFDQRFLMPLKMWRTPLNADKYTDIKFDISRLKLTQKKSTKVRVL